jgi:hypothetical protein
MRWESVCAAARGRGGFRPPGLGGVNPPLPPFPQRRREATARTPPLQMRKRLALGHLQAHARQVNRIRADHNVKLPRLDHAFHIFIPEGQRLRPQGKLDRLSLAWLEQVVGRGLLDAESARRALSVVAQTFSSVPVVISKPRI